MMRFLPTWSLLVGFSLALGCGGSESGESRGPAGAAIPLIFDTDWGPDVDDVGAVAVLHALADNGEVDILGMALSYGGDEGATSLDAVNTFYGRPDIPIASIDNVRKDSVEYRVALASNLPNDITPTEAQDPVALYRSILAAAPDRSVTILTVGFLSNLEALLESGADERSPLTGRELVAAKVALYVLMGGSFPVMTPPDYNLGIRFATSHSVLRDWPTPILFCGSEIGDAIITGDARLRDAVDSNHPLYIAYEMFNDFEGRFSWDQTAVLAAVRGPGRFWDVVDQGFFEYDADGMYRWRTDADVDHAYLVPEAPIDVVEDAIHRLMVRPPGAPLPADLQP